MKSTKSGESSLPAQPRMMQLVVRSVGLLVALVTATAFQSEPTTFPAHLSLQGVEPQGTSKLTENVFLGNPPNIFVGLL